jgi:hypothetical protein
MHTDCHFVYVCVRISVLWRFHTYVRAAQEQTGMVTLSLALIGKQCARELCAVSDAIWGLDSHHTECCTAAAGAQAE